MKKKEDVYKANELLRSHEALRYFLVRHRDRAIGMYAVDVSHGDEGVQPHLPREIGRQVMEIALALVSSGLRDLGVEPPNATEQECMECGGSGKEPIK